MGASASVVSTATAEPLLKPTIFEKAEAVVRSDPFPYTVVKGALPESARATIAADFPNYDRSGFFPYQTGECGPSVQRIVDDMQGPAFADALDDRLCVPRLSRYPSIVTIRKWSKETDGRIHNPGKSSQPQMNADKRGYSMRCLYSPTHQKGEWPRCINGMIHLLSSAFTCG